MAQATSPRGFSITSSKIPILVALRRTDELRPHEETVQKDLEAIVEALQGDPVLRHPIIADSKSGAVLDGTHRLAALKQLGCLTVPAALIDYRNPLVIIDRWFRNLEFRDPTSFAKQIKTLSPIQMTSSEAEASLLDRSNYAAIQSIEECWAFHSTTSTAIGMCKEAFALEEMARQDHATINYSDKADTSALGDSKMIMSTIRLKKSEVVESCLRHQLFPPKSTRHLIPSRPLGVTFPLKWLKEKNTKEAEAEFESHLSKMTVKRLPEGSVVGSRRYMEEVFLFE